MHPSAPLAKKLPDRHAFDSIPADVLNEALTDASSLEATFTHSAWFSRY
jgi:hypothetical protein